MHKVRDVMHPLHTDLNAHCLPSECMELFVWNCVCMELNEYLRVADLGRRERQNLQKTMFNV